MCARLGSSDSSCEFSFSQLCVWVRWSYLREEQGNTGTMSKAEKELFSVLSQFKERVEWMLGVAVEELETINLKAL